MPDHFHISIIYLAFALIQTKLSVFRRLKNIERQAKNILKSLNTCLRSNYRESVILLIGKMGLSWYILFTGLHSNILYMSICDFILANSVN